MRNACFFAFCAIVVIITCLASISEQPFQMLKTEWFSQSSSNPHYDHVQDHRLLNEFYKSLDPEVMRECTAVYDLGGQIDIDYLSTCGDFELYASYTRLSKFQAVKKFEAVMLDSSSLLEFRDRLGR